MGEILIFLSILLGIPIIICIPFSVLKFKLSLTSFLLTIPISIMLILLNLACPFLCFIKSPKNNIYGKLGYDIVKSETIHARYLGLFGIDLLEIEYHTIFVRNKENFNDKSTLGGGDLPNKDNKDNENITISTKKDINIYTIIIEFVIIFIIIFIKRYKRYKRNKLLEAIDSDNSLGETDNENY